MIADFAYAEGVQAALSRFTKLSAMNFTRPGAAGIGLAPGTPASRTPAARAAPLNVATGPNAATQNIPVQPPKPMALPIMGGAAAGAPGSVPPPAAPAGKPGVMSQIVSGVKDVAGAVAPVLAQMPMPGAAPGAAAAAPAKGGGMFQHFMNGAKGVAAPEGGSIMHALGQQAPGMAVMAGLPMVMDAFSSKKENNGLG